MVCACAAGLLRGLTPAGEQLVIHTGLSRTKNNQANRRRAPCVCTISWTT